MPKNQILEITVAAIIKHKRLLVAFLFFILIFSFYHLSKIKIDNSLSIWFVKEDATYESYKAFQEDSGSDEIIIASIPIRFQESKAVRRNSKYQNNLLSFLNRNFRGESDMS